MGGRGKAAGLVSHACPVVGQAKAKAASVARQGGGGGGMPGMPPGGLDPAMMQQAMGMMGGGETH